MLFNSYAFIFALLPVTLFGFALLGQLNSRKASLAWIVICSTVFYAAWNPVNLVLILPSIILNYLLALLIRRVAAGEKKNERYADLLLIAGIIGNLCFLGYFKYMNFFADMLNETVGTHIQIAQILLPLGISFITFQKIGFLVDVRTGIVRDFKFSDFAVFVFFFPQLIAGPIVHYREMMPQFDKLALKLETRNLAIGACLFSIGLFKKVILADGISTYVTPGFFAAGQGEAVSFFPAWFSALAYTFQIYFDFSGYTDMALGLARMFGILLPINFNSPLKASSMIEFWSRWHMTLTRFLTAYIYTPLIMNLTRIRMRQGKPIIGRKNPKISAFIALVAWPTILTMFLSGLWHGAGLTFIVWGIVHGILLVINHAWRQWHPKWDKGRYERIMDPIGFVVTLIVIAFTMVIFRAGTLDTAFRIHAGMLGFNGVVVPEAVLNQLGALQGFLSATGIIADVSSGSFFVMALVWIGVLFLIAVYAPNSLEIMQKFEPALYFEIRSTSPHRWRQHAAARSFSILQWNNRWALLMAMAFLIGLLALTRLSEFLYWQF